MDLFEFDQIVGFWGGARSRWDEYTTEQQNYLNDYIDGLQFDSLTQVNDFIWFDADEILEDEELGHEDELEEE